MQYELSKPPKGLAALDKNHSHFILVDDGTENEYGKEIKFRAAFEAYLCLFIFSFIKDILIVKKVKLVFTITSILNQIMP